MPEIHVYHEHDLDAAHEAINQGWRSYELLVREVAGAIAQARAQGRREALLEAADDWDANTNHTCDAPSFLREFAPWCPLCDHLLSEHSREHAIGCLNLDCACTARGLSEADQ